MSIKNIAGASIVIAIIMLASAVVFAATYYDAHAKEYNPKPEEVAALKIAHQECDKNGWEWRYVSIQDLGDHYHICTNCLQDGGNAEIDIDKKDGKILGSHINPM